jgi:hypothetical protein
MAPIAFALREVPRSRLRCIGQYTALESPVDYPMTWEDWDKDRAWAQSMVEHWGVRTGDFVAVVSTGHEAPWYGPILDALNALDATVCPLEPAEFEIGRARMFFTRFPIAAVIGLDGALGDGLRSAGILSAYGERLRFVLARPEAAELVTGLGVPVGLVAPVGPALGFTCHAGRVIHVNDEVWALEQRGSTATIRAKVMREHAGEGVDVMLPVSIRAAAERCACGRVGYPLVDVAP